MPACPRGRFLPEAGEEALSIARVDGAGGVRRYGGKYRPPNGYGELCTTSSPAETAGQGKNWTDLADEPRGESHTTKGRGSLMVIPTEATTV